MSSYIFSHMTFCDAQALTDLRVYWSVLLCFCVLLAFFSEFGITATKDQSEESDD